jgi:hypothetical protein
MSGTDAVPTQAGGNNASEFVCLSLFTAKTGLPSTNLTCSGPQALPVRLTPVKAVEFIVQLTNLLPRMLEDPSHQDVARWGKAGDTFVVVEVWPGNIVLVVRQQLTPHPGREVYQVDSPEALQAQ